MDERRAGLEQWLRRQLGINDLQLHPASADASFRRYFRVGGVSPTRIAVDAPPDTENNAAFIRLAQRLGESGLHVPAVAASDLNLGYLLVADLGTRSYLSELTPDSVDHLYGDALAALLELQASGPTGDDMPHYDRAMLLRELQLFCDWYLDAHLGLNCVGNAVVDESFGRLADNALQQPQVCVHRDFHSRNLMITESNNPGIIDFQDAVVGPVTYDLVSLLKDCYIAWPRARVEDWALGYRELALSSGVLREPHAAGGEQRFLRWFDLMGLQRHLKAIGIFARLHRRDGKPGYLGDIPRTFSYVIEVAERYPELAAFADWLHRDVVPLQ